MAKYFLRRVVLSIVTLGIILVIVTLIPNVAPGDPARQIAGGTASPERLQAITESLGLNDSVAKQLTDLAKSVVTADFGEAFTKPGEPVTGLVRAALWNSTKLVVFGMALMLPLSVLGGLVAAYRKDTWIDRLDRKTDQAKEKLEELFE